MSTVIGFEKVDYVSKKGNHVKGHKVYTTYESNNITGVGVNEVYIGHSVDYIPTLNDRIEVFYNRFGQVAKVSIVE